MKGDGYDSKGYLRMKMVQDANQKGMRLDQFHRNTLFGIPFQGGVLKGLALIPRH